MFAPVVGALADTIGFSPLFAVLAVFDLLGALVIWTVLKTNRLTMTRRRLAAANRSRRVRSNGKVIADQAAFSGGFFMPASGGKRVKVV